MVIEERVKTVFFGELKNGDVFYSGNLYYLKTPLFDVGDSGFESNSYDLKNNDYCYFSNETKVTLVKAKLVIE